MKRSHKVYLTILPAIALMACEENNTVPIQPANDEVKHCVDEDGGVVDESNCDLDASVDNQNLPPRPIAQYPVGYRFRWYYGGTNGTVLAPGSRISGGSFEPSVGRVYSSPSTISRGGFGSIGRGGVGAGE